MLDRANNNITPVKDVFSEFLKLEGELQDEEAKASLAEFLFHNPAFLMDILGGIKMLPMQELIIKGWMRNDYNLGVWGRGASKSFTVSLFVLIWAMFNPGCRIVVASYTFKQSKMILEQCEKFLKNSNATLLRAQFPDDIRRGTDMWTLPVPNGATIKCLPLGDGTGIRGVRADLLVVDEFAFLPEAVIGEVLRPFLASKSNVTEQMLINERESEMIKQGLMKEEDRTILDDRKKVVFLSSASYAFEHLARRFKEWIDLICLDPEKDTVKFKEFKSSGHGYFISRLSWEAVPPEIINVKEIAEAKRELSESMFNREYGAQFTTDSDGFFRASKMVACTVPDGEGPCLEIVGDPTAEYVLGVDQSLSGAQDSDHFAMCLMKIVTRQTDGKKLGMVVHSYAVAGGNLKDHMLYLFYILTKFNVVYIGVDASGGDELEFINSCNQSKTFQEKGISLLDIGADFKKTDMTGLPAEIKRGYNKTAGKIVQKQRFSSEWQRAANEYLQACFDHGNISFAAKLAVPGSPGLNRAMNSDISMLSNHEEFKEMTPSEFISNQDFLVDLTKKECSLIQVKISSLGTMGFELPQNLRRTSGASRVRKDSYSALLIANWCVKMYTEAMAVEIQTGPVDFPYMFVG